MNDPIAADVEDRSPAITPSLAVDDADRAIGWYADVLGATERVRYVGEDGRIGHAEIDIGGARLYLSDEYPEIDVIGPRTLGGSPVALDVDVPDVDVVWHAALAAGAQARRPPTDQPFGVRSSQFVDPFGHRWMVKTTIARLSHAEIDDAMDGFDVITADRAGPREERR